MATWECDTKDMWICGLEEGYSDTHEKQNHITANWLPDKYSIEEDQVGEPDQWSFGRSVDRARSKSSAGSLNHWRETAIGASYVAVAAAAVLDAGSYSWSWSSSVCNEYSDRPFSENTQNTYRDAVCKSHSVISAIAFTATTTALYHIHKGYQYQDRFLFGGISLGVTVGLGFGRDLHDTMLRFVPWAIILALVTSNVVRIASLLQRG